MTPTLSRLTAPIFSLAIAVAISYFVRNDAADPVLPAVENPPVLDCGGQRVHFMVISVPNNDEFYLGKQKVVASQISSRIAQFFTGLPVSDRVVYIKSAANVKYEILDLIMHQAKLAPVNRVEFVLDKKKASGK